LNVKTKKCSQASLLIGLLVGLAALWSSAAPIGLSGDLITAGAPTWILTGPDASANGNRVGCACSPCYLHYGNAGTIWLSCADGPTNYEFRCTGGSFLGARPVVSGGTIHASPYTGVCGGDTPEAQSYCQDSLSQSWVH
jgi:hypothetical protein